MTILPTHLPYMEENIKTHPHSVRDVTPGDVITFMYKLKKKYVLVLNNEYQDKMHGLSLEMIDRPDLLKLIRDLYLTRDPKAFYRQIEDTVRRTDAYRTYDTDKISNITLYHYKR